MSYESTTMTPAEIDNFLAQKRHAVIATNRPDGPPQISPVWYLHRDGKMYVGIDSGSAKYRNLKRDPRISLCVDGAHPDARYVIFYGTAELVEEPSAWRDEIGKAIARRYHETAEEVERAVHEMAEPGSVLLVLTPGKVISMNYN